MFYCFLKSVVIHKSDLHIFIEILRGIRKYYGMKLLLEINAHILIMFNTLNFNRGMTKTLVRQTISIHISEFPNID